MLQLCGDNKSRKIKKHYLMDLLYIFFLSDPSRICAIDELTASLLGEL